MARRVVAHFFFIMGEFKLDNIDTFTRAIENFCPSCVVSINFYFYDFLYMLRRIICMVKFFDSLPTACIMMRNRFITNLIRYEAILRVFETNVCATYD